MKHCVAAVAVSLTVGLAGCDETSPAKTGAAPNDTHKAPEMTAPADTPPPAAPPSPSAVGAEPAGAGAPKFAVVYPGAEVQSGTAQGHQISFTTDAQPDTVIDFYRKLAEASGLRPTAAMNQGGARAYGASDQTDGGYSLQVVASPTEEGLTLVQLSWNG